MKLIYKIANQFYGIEKEDLYQAGILGLIKASKNYKASSGVKFSSYAYFDIYGEMYNLASRKTLKVNRDTLKLYKEIERKRFEYAQNLGYIPNNYQLSNLLEIPFEKINQLSSLAYEILSFDNNTEYERSLYETIPQEENISIDDKVLLYSGLEMLRDEEKTIIKERYLKDETQENVARKLNISQVKVSRLEKKGIQKMKEYMSI